MGVWNCLRIMDVVESNNEVSIYRTSKAFAVLGALFIAAGIGILIKLLIPGSCAASLVELCACCIVVAVIFILFGTLLASYHKIVKIDKINSKIEIMDTSITGVYQSAIHFSDISGIEIAKDSECLFGDNSDLWVVRIYVSGIDSDKIRRLRKVERIFATGDLVGAKRVAEYLARIENVDIVDSSFEEKKLVFVH